MRRRKLLPGALPALFDDLFRTRVKGDYELDDVSKTDASGSAKNAARFVEEVDRAMKLSTLREASADYAASVGAAPSLELAERRIDELKALILSKYPEAKFGVVQLGASDFRLNAYINARTYRAFASLMGGRTSDILVDDDIWIVVIPHPLSELRNN